WSTLWTAQPSRPEPPAPGKADASTVCWFARRRTSAEGNVGHGEETFAFTRKQQWCAALPRRSVAWKSALQRSAARRSRQAQALLDASGARAAAASVPPDLAAALFACRRAAAATRRFSLLAPTPVRVALPHHTLR